MKKILTLFVALAVILSASATTYKVYLVNTAGWEHINCHAWTGDTPDEAWPGAEMGKEVGLSFADLDVYSYSTEKSNFKFSNNATSETAEFSTSDKNGLYYDNANSRWFSIAGPYYIAHKWNGGQWSWQAMTANVNGTFSYVGIWGENGCSWNVVGDATGEHWIPKENIGNYNSYEKGDWCTFTLNPTSGTVTLSDPTGTFYTVDIYHATNRTFYAFDDDNKIDFLGGWPGTAASALDKAYFNGVSWFHHAISVPSGTNLGIIFSDNGENKTSDIEVGSITGNKKLLYATSGTSPVGSLLLPGSFNSWAGAKNPFLNYISIANFNGSATFKVIDGEDWRTNITPFNGNGNKEFDTKGGSNNNASITNGTSGDYVFIWDEPSENYLTVIYPGSTYTRTGMSAGKWGTICVPYTVTSANRSGAEFYTIAGKDLAEDPTTLYLAPVGSADLVAGQPYFFKAVGTANLSLTYSGSADYAGSYNGLVGSYKNMAVAEGMYLLSNGSILKAGEGCSITANKAFIDMSKVPVGGAGAPGVRELPLAPQGPTNIKSVNANETAVKFVQDGQLLIRKNGIVYDMTGRVVR